MADNSEVEKIVEFVCDQRRHARSRRQWKRRLAAFGFAIKDTDEGPMIATLPKRKVVCPLPDMSFA
ncbi:hypothetical protein [Sinisalibacter aestuarii]|uniref:DUF4224 domain-containing protein n=1 Tax=Sinisalibacter aestuarii TaxID=2949426 RepID=A0ABQ5LMS7_9RHOB|nr:hypothetical protein [Sinisalibacter aestuarii]GKY86265.1 hypothetical protein STA1M1_01340 [Sinisalibacter aestuarii]